MAFQDCLPRKVFDVTKVLKPEDSDNVVVVSVLQKSIKFEVSLILPAVADVSVVKISDIKMMLPTQIMFGSPKE